MSVSALHTWWRSRASATSTSQPSEVHRCQGRAIEAAGGSGEAPSSGQGASNAAVSGPYAPASGPSTSPVDEAASNVAAAERWSNGQIHIRVEEQPGQLLQVAGTTHVPLPAEELFRLITHPDNERIFRHLLKVEHRQVVRSGGAGGVTVLESEQLATWRLFGLSGNIRTRLRTEQVPQEGRVYFSLLPSSSRLHLMKRFDGRWSVGDRSAGGDSVSKGEHDACGGVQQAQHAVLTLEQEAQPAFYLPPPLGSLFRSIASRHLRGIFEDIHAEADRIKQGRPTLW